MKKGKVMVMAIFMAVMAFVIILPGLARAGSLTPTAAPALTMHTLEDIYQKLSHVESMLTITTNFSVWGPNPRYMVNNNGTPDNPNDDMVLDTASGLIWARNANLNGGMWWQDAMTYCDNLVLANKDDWRLPSVDEFITLMAEPYPSTISPNLPAGHPFVYVRTDFYWASTSPPYPPQCCVYMGNGGIGWGYNGSTNAFYVWPVRGGN